MDEVPLQVVIGVFERHHLGNNESTLGLESSDLEAVLSDIYFAANKMNHMNIDVDFATEITLNFLYNVFDSNRVGNIQVSSAKLLLGILSNCSLLDLYKFFFNLCSDHNNCVTRSKLHSLLSKQCDISKYLHEDVYLGTHLLLSSIESCFESSPGLLGVTESTFITWLESNPNIFSWTHLLHRIKSSELAIHPVKCSSCRTQPVMGLLYRCVKCSRYVQCQKCFFTGRISHSHKLSHTVKEFCGTDYNKINSGEIIKKVCTLFCSKRSELGRFQVVDPVSCLKEQVVKPLPPGDCEVEPLSSPQTQLQSIIRHLESQNRELQQVLILGHASDREMRKYLEEYRVCMENHIKKLKRLKGQIKSCPDSSKNAKRVTTESTPMVQLGHARKQDAETFDYFSPIVPYNERTGSYNIPECDSNGCVDSKSSVQYTIEDLSTWIGGNPSLSQMNLTETDKGNYIPKSPVKVLHNDLDEALAKLQQILANNFSMEESLGPMDNTNLKCAVTEVEGMLTSIIDNVELSRSGSAQPVRRKFDETDFVQKIE
ncbi:dystrophin-like isoform X2 [Cylas formicarius]|nr:dystrophin-like isoform X2 [Cylas formicarius]